MTPQELEQIRERDLGDWPYRIHQTIHHLVAIEDRRALLGELDRLQTKIDAIRLVAADSYEGTRRIDGADIMAALDVEPTDQAGSDPPGKAMNPTATVSPSVVAAGRSREDQGDWR